MQPWLCCNQPKCPAATIRADSGLSFIIQWSAYWHNKDVCMWQKESSLEMELVSQRRKSSLHPFADPRGRVRSLAAWRHTFSYYDNKTAIGALSRLSQWKATTTPRSFQWILVSNILPSPCPHFIRERPSSLFLPGCPWFVIASLFLATIPLLVLNLPLFIVNNQLFYFCFW